MAVFNEPTKWQTSLVNSGDANTIPQTTPAGTGEASFDDGFPQITQIPIGAGGIAPDRKDFNGLFKILGDWIFFNQNGGVPTYSENFDYVAGRVVSYNDKIYLCIQDNSALNTHNPEDMDYWLRVALNNDLANYLPLTGGTLTGNVEIIGSKYEVSVEVNNNTQGSLYLFANAKTKGLYAQNADKTSGFGVIEVDQSSATFIGNLQGTANHAKSADNATNATNATNADYLGGYPASKYVRSVNGVDADASGNVSITQVNNATNADYLGGYPASKYVRSVNGVDADASGNVQLGNLGAITGEIKYFAFNTVPDGYIICNGASVSRETYADLFAVIGTTFGSGDGSTTFDLPDLIDKFIQGSRTVGTYKGAGLPNITASWGRHGTVSAIGAVYAGVNTSVQHNIGQGSGVSNNAFYFDASRSSSIYGNSTTVQPPALTLLPCIKY